MGDFTDLVCIGRILSQTSLELEIFFPTYNGIRFFFFSIVRHERYFFQRRIFFSQEFICKQSSITPAKVKWSAPKIHKLKHLVS